MTTRELAEKWLPTREEMRKAWVELGSEEGAAGLLHVSRWQIRQAVAEAGSEFRTSIVEAKLADLTLRAMKIARDALPKLEEWRKVNAARDLADAFRKFVGGGEGGTRNIQQIIIGATQAQSLKETMDSVEGEVVDDSNS